MLQIANASFIHIRRETRIQAAHSRREEIRDARRAGHGRASIGRVSLEIYSALFMQRLTSAFKGKQPGGGGGRLGGGDKLLEDRECRSTLPARVTDGDEVKRGTKTRLRGWKRGTGHVGGGGGSGEMEGRFTGG